MATPRPGIDAFGSAATYGGPGWRPRDRLHAEEVQEGRLWRRCGVSSEFAPLREVLLTWPGAEQQSSGGSPDDRLMLGSVDLALMRRELRGIIKVLESQGIKVHLFRPMESVPPNLIFMRDLFFMTPEGAVLARMAAQQRAGEERLAALALAQLGVPIVLAPRGGGCLEGADALWLNERCVLVGVGRRTNRDGAAQLRTFLSGLGVETVEVAVPAGVQHLLGVVNFLDYNLAACAADLMPVELRHILREHGVACVDLPADAEFTRGRGMNFLTLRPRCVIMPAQCPQTRLRLEGCGVTCYEVPVSQYLCAAGALGCMTGVLWREACLADAPKPGCLIPTRKVT